MIPMRVPKDKSRIYMNSPFYINGFRKRLFYVCLLLISAFMIQYGANTCNLFLILLFGVLSISIGLIVVFSCIIDYLNAVRSDLDSSISN